MGKVTDTNQAMIVKYKVDNTILESYFKNSKNQEVKDVVFPLRIDNRQYCSPTDYQGDKPSCCGYSAAQILEALNWMKTGKIVQMDADQIYAKAKQTDGRMGSAGTYPDLAMTKGLELVPNGKTEYKVCSESSPDVNTIKRALHKNMFVSVSMTVTKDIYDLDSNNFVYRGNDTKAGGHSMVCCGYDEESKMLIIQNHWGTIWGLKGFFLCPYDVFKRQCNLACWYEALVPSPVPKAKEAKKTDSRQEVADKNTQENKDITVKIEVSKP